MGNPQKVQGVETVEIVGREDLSASVPEVCSTCYIDANDDNAAEPTKFSVVTFSNGAEIVRGYCDAHMRIRGL